MNRATAKRATAAAAAGAENHQKPKRAVLNEVPMPRTVPTTSRMNSTVPPAYVSSAGREIATATRSPMPMKPTVPTPATTKRAKRTA